jgi:hypothetical protein
MTKSFVSRLQGLGCICLLKALRNVRQELRNILFQLAQRQYETVIQAVEFSGVLIFFWLMTNMTHSFLMYLFHASTCIEQQVLIIRRAKLY